VLLQDKNNILEQNAEGMKLSTAALEAEVEKHKHVVINAAEPALKIISAAEPALKITTWNQEVHRVQEELTKRELELKKIHREFQMTQKEMATAQAEVTDYKCKVGTLQTKVLELQTLLTKERAQTQALNLKTEEDKRKIQDLNRQVNVPCLYFHLIFFHVKTHSIK
jgi:chromosome segregation ATPase